MMKALNSEFQLIPKNILGNWYNQRGSKLCIRNVHQNGRFNGHYTSSIGNSRERADLNGLINLPPLLADKNYDLVISFTAKWKIGSLTSWVGYLEEIDNIIYLKTRWHLATPNRYKDMKPITSAVDIFTRKIIDLYKIES